MPVNTSNFFSIYRRVIVSFKINSSMGGLDSFTLQLILRIHSGLRLLAVRWIEVLAVGSLHGVLTVHGANVAHHDLMALGVL